jgi:homoserine dehydrogenase
MEVPVLRVGILGAGFVGRSLIELLRDERRDAAYVDAGLCRLEIAAIAVSDTTKVREGLDPRFVTGDPLAVASDPSIDLVVELMGGTTIARECVEAALDRGASVITANKALMAAEGTQLARRAHAHHGDLYYEAAVGGAVPILRALRTSLAGERVERVMGIVNGTTNFILTKMMRDGLDYATVLAEAQSLGLAGKDPTADVEGHDAAAKIVILSSLAFGTAMDGAAVHCEGISTLTAKDVAFAQRSGYVLKLLGVAERVGESAISRRVHPALVPISHPLAAVNNALNAVFVEGQRSVDVPRPRCRWSTDRDGRARRPADRRAPPGAQRNRRPLQRRRHAGGLPPRRAADGGLSDVERSRPAGCSRRRRRSLRRARRVD